MSKEKLLKQIISGEAEAYAVRDDTIIIYNKNGKSILECHAESLLDHLGFKDISQGSPRGY